jgi:hypothetical protein
MMHWLRHATGRLWITLLAGTGSSLGLLSLLQPAIGAEAVPVVVAAWLLLLFFAVGWAANRLGLWQVRRLLRAADQAAREGLSVEAEALFRRGLELLDSFLISPGVRRRSLASVCSRLARFYLARPGGRGACDAFVSRYLAEVPGDGEVAEQWLLGVEARGGVSDEHQGLLERLAEALPQRSEIQRALARVYLMQERTDFPALECYRGVCGGDGSAAPEFCRDVALLLRRAGCGDPWAGQLREHCSGEVPAAVEAVPRPGAVRPRTRRLEPLAPSSDGTDDDGAFRMSAALDDAEDEEVEERPERSSRGAAAAAFWARLKGLGADVRAAAASGLRRSARHVAAVRTATWGRAAGIGLGALAAAGGVWLWVEDADLRREPAVPPPAVSAPAGPAPLAAERFTLQVAAYLKAEYAHAFVESLKNKGLDAYWTETASGGKTWYQVRISHFPDRPSAREFGSRLKQKGVIEDFYVTVYSR